MPIIYTGLVQRKDRADIVLTITDWLLQGVGPSPVTPKETVVEGTPGAAIIDELEPVSGDHIVWKRTANAFYCTDLELILRNRGIDTVIITGVVTDACVVNTVRGARERSFHVIILRDCCATQLLEDDDYFMTKVFAKAGRVRTSAEMISVISKAGI